MPTRTEDPPRTRPQVPAAPVSSGLTPRASGGSALPTREEDDDLTRDSFRAIFSSHQRAGRWEPADEIQARAICGEVVLDFTRAVLPESGEIEIEAWAICGEVRIVVPDGADVELLGTPILGSIEQQVRRKGTRERIREWVTGERDEDLPVPPQPPEPPYFRIDCHAILGAVKVTGR